MAVTVETAQGRKILLEKSSATVGRDPGCTVAFPEDQRLLPQHAVLREVSGRWMNEAKGPQFPQIGDGPPARVHWLNPGDVIRLTPQGPELTFQPASETAAAESGLRGSLAENATGRQGSRGLRSAIWAGAAVTAIAAVFVAVFVLGDRRPRDGDAAGQSQPTPRESVAPPRKEATAVVTPQDEPGAAQTPAVKADIRNCLYSVTVRAAEQQQVFQLGTACAVAHHQLLTSAAVAEALESLKDKLPVAAVSSPVSHQRFDIVGWTVHPQYLAAVADAGRAQENAAAAAEQLQDAATPAERERLASGKADAEQAYAEAIGRQAVFDVALLEIREKLPAIAPLPTGRKTALTVGSRTVVAGIPFDVKNYMVDPDAPSMPKDCDAQIFALAPVGETPDGPQGVVIKVSTDLADQNWSGSALLDTSGKVIAVYSRPAVTPANNASAAGAHVASSVDRLPEFAQELVHSTSPE